ncbi:hypothetical protein BDP27DRAFT_1428123 [Rhodocollybia butyracea]|uniref:RRM domain-containing protein n=1 Tax=Rhodocollybia butyracea TaxID=206335 RepID=A0A9P5U046_9AGAR|nr:hypothetical protein BDP27DRAFT_1428123 [Rhodocollybia butyracea]
MQPGYRRLYLQKSIGPMRFVKTEDVNAAKKTINGLHGNTLNGLVEVGGIRLSKIQHPTSADGHGPSRPQ